MPKVEIISYEPKVEEALKELLKHNDKEFEKAGFMVQYSKQDEGKFILYLIPLKTEAMIGFKIAGGMLVGRMRKIIKKSDPKAVIKMVED